jgi:hypothetical protein
LIANTTDKKTDNTDQSNQDKPIHIKVNNAKQSNQNSISTQINIKERGRGKGGEPEKRCKNPSYKRIEKGEAEVREASKFETNVTTYKHTKAIINTWINFTLPSFL